MRRWISRLLILALVLGGGGFALIWSGVIPIAASSGHWAVTAWILHFAMRRSVATHALGIAAPPLDDPRLIRRGAGHYATGCAPCHGAPGLERSAIARQMTPAPPYLPTVIDKWDAAELFRIVRHGVKFTGMPAWIAQSRPDEVWAVVALLRAMKQLDPAAYRRLAFGDVGGQPVRGRLWPEGHGLASLAPPEQANCVRCHGRDGGTDGGAFPLLAGQSEDYLYASLRAFADGTRFSGIMQAAVAGLDSNRLRALARHYAAASPPPAGSTPALAGPEIRAGERLARQGAPERGVPPCAACHGLAEGPRYSRYPSLAGQPEGYLAQQLELFRKDARGGTSYAHIMRTIAQRLDARQSAAVAAYYASLPPSERRQQSRR